MKTLVVAKNLQLGSGVGGAEHFPAGRGKKTRKSTKLRKLLLKYL